MMMHDPDVGGPKDTALKIVVIFRLQDMYLLDTYEGKTNKF